MLSDQATTVGVQLADRKVVAKENILDRSRPLVTYKAANSSVFTFAVDQHANVLLAGETSSSKGRLLQYRLDTGELTHDYGSLGIGAMGACARLGNLCFFGGYDSSRFAVVDVRTQKIAQSPVATAVSTMRSLEVRAVNPNTPDAKAILTAAGVDIDYSAHPTDIFDVTQLVHRHGSPEYFSEFPVLMLQHHKKLLQKVRTLEQRLRELRDEHQVEATVNASLKARISSLESDNQALRDALRSLKKKRRTTKKQLRKQTAQNERQVQQKVILGLLQSLPTGLDVDADANPDLAQAPDAGVQNADTEDLQARLAAARRRNRTLTALNHEFQDQIVDLRTQVRTLRARCGEW